MAGIMSASCSIVNCAGFCNRSFTLNDGRQMLLRLFQNPNGARIRLLPRPLTSESTVTTDYPIANAGLFLVSPHPKIASGVRSGLLCLGLEAVS